MQAFILFRPLIADRNVMKIQIRYVVLPQTCLDRRLVAFGNENMYFNSARGQMRCPVPTNSWLTTGVWPARVSRKQNSHVYSSTFKSERFSPLPGLNN